MLTDPGIWRSLVHRLDLVVHGDVSEEHLEFVGNEESARAAPKLVHASPQCLQNRCRICTFHRSTATNPKPFVKWNNSKE
jgi:hypothetical protein